MSPKKKKSKKHEIENEIIFHLKLNSLKSRDQQLVASSSKKNIFNFPYLMTQTKHTTHLTILQSIKSFYIFCYELNPLFFF